MIHKKIIVKDIPISYCISDNFDNQKTTFLFLHGRGQNGQSFQSIFDFMAQDKLSFVSIDFPWFGNSPRPKGTWWVQEYAECVKEFMTKTRLSKVVCVGHSFGCRIAFELSANNPDIFTQQIAIWPAGIETKSSRVKTKIKIAKIVKTILPKIITDKAKETMGSRDYKNAQTMKDIFVKVINYDQTKLFHKIKIPTIILRWTQDIEIPQKKIDIMRSQIKHVKVITFEGASHFLFQEHPKQVYEIIKKSLVS